MIKYFLLVLAGLILSLSDYIMEQLGKHPIIGGVGAGGGLTIGLSIKYMPLLLITEDAVRTFQVGAFGVSILIGALTIIAWLKKHTTFLDKVKFFKKDNKE